MRCIYLSSVGRMVLSVPNAEGQAVTSCMGAWNMSANTVIVKAQSQRGRFCAAPIFRLREGYVHHYRVFYQNSDALHWVHTLISNLKSFLLGTYRGLGNKHLQSYFDEFSSHFNRRFWLEQLFPRLVCAVTASNILGCGDLTR